MEQTQDLYKTRGYSDDLLPKSDTQRNWKTFNYFTLWMGSVHNVPNYVMVGGFIGAIIGEAIAKSIGGGNDNNPPSIQAA